MQAMNDPSEDMLCLQDCDETVADFYRLESPNVPWGDYGSILVHGMTSCSARDPGSPELHRTGPFVPPISFPGLGCVVVTDIARNELQSSGLTGFSFVPAIKSAIIPIDWHDWDLLSDEPPFYPDGGEPESYISEDRHSPELARRMPKLWRVLIAPGATEIREPSDSLSGVQIFIRGGSWHGADVFHADTTLHIYVSPRARQWLLDLYPAWVSFKPVEVK
jgi:hypothetical protein